MTALTVVRAADRDVTTLRLTRAAWHHHRAAFLTIAGVFGAGVLALAVEGVWMRYDISRGHLAACLRAIVNDSYYVPPCGARGLSLFMDNKWNAGGLQDLLAVAPLLVALFAGLPWLTREFESGSFRYTWAQEAGRTRWLLGTFLPLTIAAAGCAGIVSAAFAWWYRDAQATGGIDGSGGWALATFGDSPELLVAFTVLGMSFALLAGVLIRRTVPAMAVCTAACVACYAVTQEWFRNWLITRAPVISKSPFYIFDPNRVPATNDLWLRSYTTGPHGQLVVSIAGNGSYNNSAFQAQILRISSSKLPGWLAQHHYLSWVAYQPHSRLTGFEFAEAEVVLAIAVIVFAAALIVFRRVRLFAGLYSPVWPSTDSRSMSAWPLWRAYSSIMWHKIQRRLGTWPSGQARLASWPRSPSASASVSRARERSTLSCHSVNSSSGVSSAAVRHSQSGSAFQSTESHGSPSARPCRSLTNQLLSTRAMCLSSPPRVIVEAAVVARSPAASTPEHFQAKVARCQSRKPTSIPASSATSGGSGRPYSSIVVMGDYSAWSAVVRGASGQRCIMTGAGEATNRTTRPARRRAVGRSPFRPTGSPRSGWRADS
jgi:hypothetical protein